MNIYTYPTSNKVDTNYIINKVCEFYQTNYEDLKRKCQKEKICKPRRIAIYILSEIYYYDMTQEAIAGLFNLKHSNVGACRKVVETELEVNKNFKIEYEQLIKSLNH